MKNNFLTHIHYFRGFAIINIAFIHLWVVSPNYADSPATVWIDLFREVFFHGSTIYFLFVSGVLFYHLSHKFRLWPYYRNKIKNVLIPYCLLTLFLFIYLGMSNGFCPDPERLCSSQNILHDLWDTLRHGSVQMQYWYIPFIAIVFLVSPLFLIIPQKAFDRLAFISFFLPLFGTRTDTSITLGQYIYHLPVYILGMYSAMHSRDFFIWVEQRKKSLLLVVILSTYILFSWGNHMIVLLPFNFSESIFYIQKLAMCFLILCFFKRIEHQHIPLLHTFGTYSFSVFFLHTVTGSITVTCIYDVLPDLTKFPVLLFFVSLLAVILSLLSNLTVCIVLKNLIGKNSRYIIGT